MRTDSELLREYAETGSEAAFTELVRRNLDFTYSVALRLLAGDRHRAQDAAQKVFIELARHARSLCERESLAGWLHRSARFAAIMAIRGESRRRAREQEAHPIMQPNEPAVEFPWEHARPLLDEAIDGLDETDREAVLLRFFQQKSHREVGAALGLQENTARMRVDRALEKLRAHFVSRGITAPAGALAAALAANAVQAAPAGLAGAVASASLAGTSTAAPGLGHALAKFFFMTTKTQAALIAALAVAITAAVPLALQQREIAHLRNDRNGESSPARAISRPRLPAPRVVLVPAPAPEPSTPPNALMQRLLNGQDFPKLAAEQLAAYLDANQRNAASLLAAYGATRDASFLQEAMEKYPGDPRVAYNAYFAPGQSSEERRRWLDQLKKDAPDNAMASLLSTYDLLQSGETDLAVQELAAGLAKPEWDDYLRDSMQDTEEAYRAAGYSEGASKLIAVAGANLPGPAQLRGLGQTLAELADAYQKSGDSVSAQAVLQMAANLGRRVADAPGQPVVTTGSGLLIERKALRAMDPSAPIDDAGHTVQDRLNVIAEDLAAVNTIAPLEDALFAKFTDADIAAFFDRQKTFGELEALRWAQKKYGAPPVNKNAP